MEIPKLPPILEYSQTLVFQFPARLWNLQKHNWRRLLAATPANTRFLVFSSLFWSLPLALTEPYRGLYYSRLGLDPLQIGAVVGLDMGLRIVGVVLGGLLPSRLGYRNTLNLFDLTSWVVPALILGLARHPWQVTLATVFFSTNSMGAAAYQCLFLEGVRDARRGMAYGMSNLTNILPGVLLPWLASWLVTRFDFVQAMRVMFLCQSALMLAGICLRQRGLRDVPVPPLPRGAAGGGRAAAARLKAEFTGAVRALARSRRIALILPLSILFNLFNTLWGYYYPVYVTRQLGLPDSLPGILAEAGALCFAVSTIVFLPRVRPRGAPGVFFLAQVAGLSSLLLLKWAPGPGGLLCLAVFSNLSGAVVTAILAALFAGAMPEGSRAWAFGLSFCLQQAVLALGVPFFGGLFQIHFGYFPWAAMGLALAQAAFGFALWKGGLGRPQIP